MEIEIGMVSLEITWHYPVKAETERLDILSILRPDTAP